MFSLTNENTYEKNIKFTAVTFKHKTPTSSCSDEFYCAIQSHLGIESDSAKWKKCGSIKLPRRQNRTTELEFSSPVKVGPE